MTKYIVKTKDGWISIREAIEMLGITRMTLDKFIKEGRILAEKQINNQKLINKKSVDKFIKERLNRLRNVYSIAVSMRFIIPKIINITLVQAII